MAVMALPHRSEADGPFEYHTLMPCRLADTRDPNGPTGGPILQTTVIRKFPVQGMCGVPIGAKAVTVNVTAVTPAGQGHLRVYPSDIAVPTVSALNFAAGDIAVGNGAIVALADDTVETLDLAIYPLVVGGAGTVHVILDVTGYFL